MLRVRMRVRVPMSASACAVVYLGADGDLLDTVQGIPTHRHAIDGFHHVPDLYIYIYGRGLVRRDIPSGE